MKPKIVCWIPIDDKCNVLFDQIKPGEKEFTSEAERRPLPFPITDKVLQSLLLNR